jgi:purine-nucleoside phosphorylase
MNTLKDILVPRLYATSFSRDRKLSRVARSFLGSGAEVIYNNRKVTFFYPGYGQRIRKIPDSIVSRINRGEITDIVDIGAGGALNPQLQIGDLVLSTEDYSIDGEALRVKRRPEAEQIAKKLADDRGLGFYKGKILTTRDIVHGREERLRLHEELECAVVQMEHFWFANALKKAVSREAYDNLYFTHIELISDEVPVENPNRIKGVYDFLRALDFCVFRNQKHIGEVKSEFLRRLIDYLD